MKSTFYVAILVSWHEKYFLAKLLSTIILFVYTMYWQDNVHNAQSKVQHSRILSTIWLINHVINSFRRLL